MNTIQKQHEEEVFNLLEKERGYRIIKYINKSTNIDFICKCGKQKSQLFKDLKRRECRSCKGIFFKDETPKLDIQDVVDEHTGEIWRRIDGAWISSHGRAKNLLGKLLTLCPVKKRYTINKVNKYASRLVVMAFKIEGCENLDTQNYVVTHIDGDNNNNRVDNLKVVSKTEIRNSGRSKGILSKLVDVSSSTYVVVPEFPNCKIYSNGEIWNGSRFLEFTHNNNYYKVCGLDGCKKTLYVHRIVCYAFHPLNGKTIFEDYKDLQVNHIDGNTLNNNKDNLEWTTQSENMQHAYDNNLNSNKCRRVRQLNKETNELIKEFQSVSLACRETGETEHAIRQSIKGKDCKRQYNWQSCDPEKDKINSLKYSHTPN